MAITTNTSRNIRRSFATALAAGTLVLGFGLTAPNAHAAPHGPDDMKISPCVIDPESCQPDPDPTVPEGPDDKTLDPCFSITHGDCESDPHGPDDFTTPTTDPDDPGDAGEPEVPDADPADAVHTTASFTG